MQFGFSSSRRAVDELGNGSDTQNHCNCFMEVLHAVGYVIPDVKSREFADMKGILDASFTKPAFVAAASLFSSQLEAEIIGTAKPISSRAACASSGAFVQFLTLPKQLHPAVRSAILSAFNS